MEKIGVNLHYTDLLFEELQKRCKKNSKYSLRSFSRDLSLSPSYLSRVLRKESCLTLTRAQEFSKKLTWTSHKINLFFQLIQYHNCRSGLAKAYFESQIEKSLKNKSVDSHLLSQCHQSILVHWYDLAIVELTLHPDFDSSPEWISQILSISQLQCKEAIRRLLFLGVLHYNGSNLKRSHNRYWIGNFHSKSIQNFHRQHLNLAEKALSTQRLDERHFMGSSFGIHTSQIPIIKNMLQDFHEQILNLSEKIKPNHIYHLATQLYRLDQLKLVNPEISNNSKDLMRSTL